MIDTTSNMIETTRTAKPIGPPAAANAALLAMAAALPAATEALTADAAILAALLAVAATLPADAATLVPFAARTPFFMAAVRITSNTIPPPIPMAIFFTISILAMFGLGG